jgi:YD repeat-containing protein
MNVPNAISLKTKLRLVLLLAATMLLSGLSMRVAAATTYSYDSLNRFSQTTYSDGTVLTYTYDGAGNRLTQVVTGGVSHSAPSFTSATNTTFTVGMAGSFIVTATGNPAPTFSATGLPSWASLNSTSGVLNGMPTNKIGAPFTINLTATNGVLPNATQVFMLGIVVTSKPSLSTPTRPSSSQFQMLLDGVAGQNYTVQTTTNLASTNWSTLLITNAPGSSIQIIDPHATNQVRFYRVLFGP